MARVNQTTKDAVEFGVGVRCGGWRLGFLVARNVAPGKAGRPSKDANPSLENEKISMTRFSELAGVSVSHVKYYYDAWELAAKAGLVPSSEQILLGDDDVDIEADSIEVEDNPRTHWSHFYGLAKTPPKQKEKKEKKEKDAEDDFGIQEEKTEINETEEIPAEIDRDIYRNELLELLESLQAISSRLTRISEGDNDLLSQIASAAMSLGMAADAMMTKDGEMVVG